MMEVERSYLAAINGDIDGALQLLDWKRHCFYVKEDEQRVIIDLSAIDRAVEGAQEAGMEIRLANYRICLHASDGVDQRSCRGLRDPDEG
ncbi:MAG: hypothetical protein K0Q73_8293 [Paenibacillus sp.]|jgi:hypothetical protein|nr:hypothetical protein [Paenibacillus sp.]